MDEKIILGRILQKLIDTGVSQYEDYNKFGYINHNNNYVTVSRENGEDTTIPFSKLFKAILSYQGNIDLYDKGPTVLRDVGITHITSPVHSLLHLISKGSYL